MAERQPAIYGKFWNKTVAETTLQYKELLELATGLMTEEQLQQLDDRVTGKEDRDRWAIEDAKP